MKVGRKHLVFVILSAVVAALFSVVSILRDSAGEEETSRKSRVVIVNSIREEKPSFIKTLFSDFSFQYSLFKESKLERDKFVYRNGRFLVIFSVDPLLQEAVERNFRVFKVKYGAFVAIEPKSGRVLAASSSIAYPDLTIKRSFPTASTFKIVTAAAALDLGIADIKTVLNCGGVGDSCSPYVWLNSSFRVDREFGKSFATSANPFFGNLGRLIGKEKLLYYANLFGFNEISFNFPWGVVREPFDDYELALLAAGLGDSYTSPFHEAVISQVILNDGVMMVPHLVDKVVDLSTGEVYEFPVRSIRRVVSKETARKIKDLMILTVKEGTVSRKRHFLRLRRNYPEVIIGGKTGTLTEKSYPEGRCEWFTGFFSVGEKSIAFSSVAVNGKLYYISGYELAAVVVSSFLRISKKGGMVCVSSVK